MLARAFGEQPPRCCAARATARPAAAAVTNARIAIAARSCGFEQQPGAGEAGAEGGHQHALAAGRARSAGRARTAPSARSCCRSRAAPRARGRARPAARSSAVSIASITLTPPGWQQKRSMSPRGRRRACRASSSTAGASSRLDERRDGAVEDDGEAGILDVPAHDPQRVRPQFLGRAGDRARGRLAAARRTAAAAPSPNKAVATIAAGSSLSRRIEIEQVSTVTNSQLLPGSAAASRAAVASPLTPPAQPRPNTGTRRTSSRRPSRGPTRASRLGVAMPVVETVTTPSISAGVRPAPGDRRRRGLDEQLLRRLRDRRALRSAQPCGCAYQSSGRDEVAPGDAGIVEHARQPVEQRRLPPNALAADRLCFRLRDDVRRNRGRQRE